MSDAKANVPIYIERLRKPAGVPPVIQRECADIMQWQSDEIERLRAALERNVQERHRYKHIETGHHCGWRVIAEAMIERSREALRDD